MVVLVCVLDGWWMYVRSLPRIWIDRCRVGCWCAVQRLRVFVCCCSGVKGSRPTKAYPDVRVKMDKVLQLSNESKETSQGKWIEGALHLAVVS